MKKGNINRYIDKPKLSNTLERPIQIDISLREKRDRYEKIKINRYIEKYLDRIPKNRDKTNRYLWPE